MYILPQILNIETKNFIINQLIDKFKEILHKFFDNINSKNTYHDYFLNLQLLSNEINKSIIINLFEAVDNVFKNSKERKDKFYINKSNVPRTLITIFGTITFNRTLYQDKITGEFYFYLDNILGLEAYKNYDPLVRAILVQDSVLTNPNHTSIFSSLNTLNLKEQLINNISIPKQTIYNFIKESKIRKVNYDAIEHDKALYVMVDEKWIHAQDKKKTNTKKWIMAKCFVVFTGIHRKGKRNRLVNRHVFITSSNKPWKEFMNEIYKIYDFEKLENINLLSDAGSWILSGAHEMKLYSHNKITINTCEFHVKQKINRSTHDKELRQEIVNIIYEFEDKKTFIEKMDNLINNATKDSRKEKITEYKKYILKHWKGIINMKHSLCKSSMEAHIQHCVASYFSSVPKAYSKENIETYLKLQELFLNNISILEYCLKTYDSDDDYIFGNEKEVFHSPLEQFTSNIPIIRTTSPYSSTLYGIAHPI